MLFDRQGRCLTTNRNGLLVLGLPEAAVLGRQISELFLEQFHPVVNQAVGQVLAGEESSFEATSILPGGSRVNWHGVLNPIPTVTNEVRDFVGVFTDVSERRLAERQIKRSDESQKTLNALLRLALEDLDLHELLRRALALVLDNPWPATLGVGAVFLVDEGTRELVLEAHNGIAPEIVRRCTRVKFGDCLCGRVALFGEALFCGALDDRHEIAYPDISPHGHYCIPIAAGETMLGVLNVYVAAGHPWDAAEEEFLAAFASTLASIIVRKRGEERLRVADEQLRQAQRMEAIGRLAGGVAHDFNNLLTVILGYTEMLLADGAGRRAEVERIQDAATRAVSLTRQLLAFSRKQVLQPVVLDLNDTVSRLHPMLRRLIGEDIDMVVQLTSRSAPVTADPAQVEQIVMNLVLNARDAMPHGGRLVTQTGEVLVESDGGAGAPALPPGPYITLSVTDTGCGMDSTVLAHLFEPFFTTKKLGEGTGLGLATVYGIVKQSGGHITVDSESGRGAIFTVYLPRAADAAGIERPGARIVALAGGSETILLVEDNDDVRELAVIMLRACGYAVLTARDGDDAARVCEQHDGSIHLLLTDVILPGKNGRELAEEMSRQRPDMKVLYMSGYPDNVIAHHGGLQPGVAFLQKPYSRHALSRKVREVLDGPAEGSF